MEKLSELLAFPLSRVLIHVHVFIYLNGVKQMSELIRVKCQSGHIVVTENAIRVETNLMGKGQKSLSRSMLTGVNLNVYPKLFGLGGIHSDLTFYGQGSEVLIAKIVRTEEARRIVNLLGY
jgi:hypothetical protein